MFLTATGAQGGGSMIIMMLVMVVIFYFFLIRPENKKKKQAETAWDGVEVKEEGTKSADEKEVLYKRNKKGEIVTNKKGEKVTRKPSYAGEDEGWSPIVSPDDLKKNK